MKNADIIRAVKQAARDKYAWPGGYPLIVVMSDCEVMCCDCARENFDLIGRATRDNDRSGWAAAGVDIHWEGPPELCCHCGGEIPSAYGDPDEGVEFYVVNGWEEHSTMEAAQEAAKKYLPRIVSIERARRNNRDSETSSER